MFCVGRKICLMSKPSRDRSSLLRQIFRLLLPLLEKLMSPASETHTAPTPRSKREAKPKSKSKSEGSARRSAPPTQASKRKTSPSSTPRISRGARSPIGQLHAKRQSDAIITDSGVIVKVLPDDLEGSRHQRLLVEVDRGRVTIKVAHNIDLAPRVPAREGDHLTFHGEYEWNALGGALHWTHHDPKQWREGGWIEHKGKRYE